MFGMVLDKLFITELRRIQGNIERKIVGVGVTRLLCECPEMYTGNYQKQWMPLLQALLQFIEMPPDETTLPDDHFIEVDDTPTFQSSSAKLNFANRDKIDPLQGEKS